MAQEHFLSIDCILTNVCFSERGAFHQDCGEGAPGARGQLPGAVDEDDLREDAEGAEREVGAVDARKRRHGGDDQGARTRTTAS